MRTLILAALIAAEPAAPAPPTTATSVLVLRTGQRMAVRSYRVEGRILRIVGADGSPLMMRAEQADLEASAAATRTRAAALQAKADEAQAAEAKAAAEREARRAANEATRAATTRKAGTLSSADGTAARDVSSAHQDEASDTVAPSDPVRENGQGDWPSRLEAMRSRWRAIGAEGRRLRAEHDALVRQHNDDKAGLAERAVAVRRVAELRSRLSALDAEAAALKSDYARAQTEARQAGAPPSSWNKQLSGDAG